MQHGRERLPITKKKEEKLTLSFRNEKPQANKMQENIIIIIRECSKEI
jgi:hypothetical protein